MLKNTKAQGMSIKIIIVAIIGLIILLVVVLMLTGKLGDFSGGIEAVGNPLKTCDKQTPAGELKKDCTSHKVQIASRDSGIGGDRCCIPKP